MKKVIFLCVSWMIAASVSAQNTPVEKKEPIPAGDADRRRPRPPPPPPSVYESDRPNRHPRPPEDDDFVRPNRPPPPPPLDVDEDFGRPPAIAIVPAQSCVRASYEPLFCGGFSPGVNEGCAKYCGRKGYPFQFCSETYCLCHRGLDFGRACERISL